MSDKLPTPDGGEVEFLSERRQAVSERRQAVSERRQAVYAKVVPLRTALAVAALCTAMFGGVTVFALRALIREEILSHQTDQHAHSIATQQLSLHVSREDQIAAERREMLERVTRIESKLNSATEMLGRLEERMRPR